MAGQSVCLLCRFCLSHTVEARVTQSSFGHGSTLLIKAFYPKAILKLYSTLLLLVPLCQIEPLGDIEREWQRKRDWERERETSLVFPNMLGLELECEGCLMLSNRFAWPVAAVLLCSYRFFTPSSLVPIRTPHDNISVTFTLSCSGDNTPDNLSSTSGRFYCCQKASCVT